MDKIELENQQDQNAVNTPPADNQTTEQSTQETQSNQGEEKSLSDAISEKIDAIEANPHQTTEEGELEQEQTGEAQDEVKQKEEEKSEEAPAEEKPKTPEEEEADLINTAKTDRGKERLQRVFAERREGLAAKQNLEQVVTSFRGAGFDGDSLNTVLQIGRLVSSGDKDQIRLGIQAIDKIRANLCSELGEDVAAKDPLDEYPDIKQSVEQMGMDRKQAYELIRARVAQQEQARAMQAQQQALLEQQRTQAAIKQAQQQVQQFFFSHSQEVDFGRKVKAIQAHLTPQRIAEFTRTVPPEQWAAQIEIMWNNLSIRSQNNDRARPISQRSVNRGAASFDANKPLSNSIEEFMSANGM